MIYFYYGDEEFCISNKIKLLKNQLDPNYIEMSYQKIKHPIFTDLISIIRTQPMMFGKILIEIDIANYFFGKNTDNNGLDDKQIAQLSEALEYNNENKDIVFTAIIPPNSEKKIDKRKKLFKILSKYESQEFAKIPSYKTGELEDWIKTCAKSKNLKISSDVASQLLIQIGADLRLLDSEIEKLKIYSNDKAPTVETVKEICTTNEDLFIFIDYLINSNFEMAIKEYKKLITKKHPLEILSVLQTMLRQKIKIKAFANQYSAEDIAKEINIHPYRVKLELQKLKNISLKHLVKLKEQLTESEYRIKSGQSNFDPEMEIEYAILQ